MSVGAWAIMCMDLAPGRPLPSTLAPPPPTTTTPPTPTGSATKKQLNVGVHVCRLCHRGIHRLYDELTLARDFNTLEQLLADEALAKHFAWVSKQKEQKDSPNWL